MSNAKDMMYGPFYYNPSWVLGALMCLLVAGGIIALAFYLTRKKEVRSLGTLKILPPKVVNLNALKRKYVHLIDQSEAMFYRHKIKASTCHQQLSMLVRLYYCETMGFHAEIMTLSDLKKSHYTELIRLIDSYYPDEFDCLERGAVGQAAEKARRLVEEQ